MKSNTLKTALFSLALFGVGCGTAQTPASFIESQQVTQRVKPFANVSQQQTIQNQMGVHLKFKTSESFNIKDTDGTPGKKAADIRSFELFLVRSTSQPAPGSLSIEAGPYPVSESLTASTQDFTFRNLQPGTYYICAAAFQSAAPAAPQNITKSTSYTYGNGNCALSSAGGEANSGRVKVNSDMSITETDTLQVQIPLLDGEPNAVRVKLHVQDYDPD